MTEHNSSDFNTHAGAQVASGVLNVVAFAVFLASLFSFPFPLSRVVWLMPGLGVSGLINSGLLFWIAQKVKKLSMPAIFAALGLVAHELVLTWAGFYHLTLKRAPGRDDIFFLTGSSIALILFAFFLFHTVNLAIIRAANLNKKTYLNKGADLRTKNSVEAEALLINVMFYAVFIALAFWATKFDLKYQYTAFRNFSKLSCMVSFMGIGQEITFYLDQINTRAQCIVKSLTHLIALTAVLWVIYHLNPLDYFIIS